MSDVFSQLRAARAYHDSASSSEDIFNLPPGYIQGFQPVLADNYRVRIRSGAANVSGSMVRLISDYEITGEDWVSPINFGKHYYIYLSRSGGVFVDNQEAVYDEEEHAFYHLENSDWRRLGILYLSEAVQVSTSENDGFEIQDNGKVIFCGDGEKQSPSVVVGASTYVEKADYFCNGARDEIQINAAIRYVSEAFGGGIVTLTSGTFNVGTIPILLRNGVIIEGAYTGSVINVDHAYDGIKTLHNIDGTYLGDQLQLKNFKITRTDTNNKNAILLEHASEILVENIVIDDWTRYGLEVNNCENAIIRNVIAKNGTDRGIYLNDTQGIVEDCVVHTLTSTAGCIGILAETPDESTRGVSVVNCEVYNLSTSSSDGVDLVGISIIGDEGTSEPTVIQGNQVHDITTQNVNAEALGITNTGGKRKNIQGNTIYNLKGWNKADAGGAAIRLATSGSDHPDDCAVLTNVIDNCNSGIVIADSNVDRTFLSGNKVSDCGQLVKLGGCESATSPSIDGTAASVVECTWAISTDQAYQGTYSYKFTHTGSSAKSYAYLQDGTATSDLHGLVAGVEYTLEMWVKLTTIPYDEFAISIADYQSSWAATAQATVSGTDWQKVSVTRTIRSAATGVSLYLGANVDTETSSGEIAYVDNIRLYPTGYQNSNNNCLADSGTGTLY